MNRRNVVAALVFWLLAGGLVAGEAQERMDMKADGAYVTIAAGERAVLRYHYTDVPFKPYVLELYSPKGFNVVREAPADHLHHHGLMFAVAVDGVDFWAETETCGKQIHRGFKGMTKSEPIGPAGPSFTEILDWVPPGDGAVLLNEQRTIQVHPNAAQPATLLTWTSQLAPAEGLSSVTLTGSHYFGLGMRFPASMDSIGTFRNAAGNLGEVVRGEERNGRAVWSCYSAVVDGKPVTVAMFDDPGNARHPATWFTMPVSFAYMSATLDLKTEPLVIDAEKPLTLRYGVAVWDAEVTDEQIEQLYQRWLTLPHE